MLSFLLFTFIVPSPSLRVTPSDYYQPFGMSLKLFEQDGTNLLCLASIDSRIAHFDNPIEWLQMSLQQQPCANSQWIVLVASPSALDHSVVDILKNYASVDLIASDIDPTIPSAVHTLPNVTIDVSSTTITDTSTGSILLGEPSPGSRKFVTKPLSKTSSSNIVWAIVLSCLSGLILNISARVSDDERKRTLYTNIST